MKEKLNLKSALAVLALILCSSGVVLVFKQIRDTGVVDIKTPILTGKLETGFVGVTLVFLGVLVAALAVYRACKQGSPETKQQLVLQKGNWKISYTGEQFVPSDWDKFAVMFERVVNAAEGEKTGSNNMPQGIRRSAPKPSA